MERLISYTFNAKKDIDFFKKHEKKNVLREACKLIKAIQQNPFQGSGMPEQLKHKLSGCWSRKINRENRIIYEVLEDRIIIHSLKGHE